MNQRGEGEHNSTLYAIPFYSGDASMMVMDDTRKIFKIVTKFSDKVKEHGIEDIRIGTTANLSDEY